MTHDTTAGPAAEPAPTGSVDPVGAQEGTEQMEPSELTEPGPAAPVEAEPTGPSADGLDVEETSAEASSTGETEPDVPVACPTCGVTALRSAVYCEECGAALTGAGGGSARPGAHAASASDPTAADDEPTLSVPAPPVGQLDDPAAPASGDTAETGTDPAGDGDGDPAADEDTALPSDDFGSPEPYGTPLSSGFAASAYATTRSVPAVAPAIRVCSYCQGTIAPDGYCLECGEREVSSRDRFGERPAAWLAGVSDLGLVHRRNEDALSLAVASGGGAAPAGTGVVVVCDGVTTAPHSDVASLAAAQAASGAMWRTIVDGDPRAPRRGLLAAAVQAAHAAAVQAVLATTPPDLPADDAPSCTFVACAAEPGTIVTGWVGDSRAYWLPDDGAPKPLTVDHSWAAEMIAEGMSEAEAMAAPNAHAITRWIGHDAPGDGPEVAWIHPEGAGLLLVCSDGLWNYCSDAAELAELVARTREERGAGLEAIALGLVDWARAQGGRDNISVALARVDSLEPATSTAPTASAPASGAVAEPARPVEPAGSAEPAEPAEPASPRDPAPTADPVTTTDPDGKDTDGDVQR
ncbi:MAG: hypothetical protein BGO96_07030 [Micrococcales bacterium 73-15]|uniref:protein phosphatase 2C domain-containing protein n=1 Tax=Salana multivorans TaxID=120377 RepID=UPI00095DB461|nr:PP2C family serine/threonine-protein phosphatase [Salana multivorans]OJX96037.1 MAG: hypothetical protein BGO96_07030 [Micrococcales bacterium 73-15]